jgi:hypothetical protein
MATPVTRLGTRGSQTFGSGDRAAWSRYATELYLRLLEKAKREGWGRKLRYLLYEARITDTDAERCGNLEGLLLQSPESSLEGYQEPACGVPEARRVA